jgi:hypothetical protein
MSEYLCHATTQAKLAPEHGTYSVPVHPRSSEVAIARANLNYEFDLEYQTVVGNIVKIVFGASEHD